MFVMIWTGQPASFSAKNRPDTQPHHTTWALWSLGQGARLLLKSKCICCYCSYLHSLPGKQPSKWIWQTVCKKKHLHLFMSVKIIDAYWLNPGAWYLGNWIAQHAVFSIRWNEIYQERQQVSQDVAHSNMFILITHSGKHCWLENLLTSFNFIGAHRNAFTRGWIHNHFICFIAI